jgi:hypothetical protein
MAHKTKKSTPGFWGRTRPNKKSKKHPAQSKRDKEKFLKMKESESPKK